MHSELIHEEEQSRTTPEHVGLEYNEALEIIETAIIGLNYKELLSMHGITVSNQVLTFLKAKASLSMYDAMIKKTRG